MTMEHYFTEGLVYNEDYCHSLFNWNTIVGTEKPFHNETMDLTVD